MNDGALRIGAEAARLAAALPPPILLAPAEVLRSLSPSDCCECRSKTVALCRSKIEAIMVSLITFGTRRLFLLTARIPDCLEVDRRTLTCMTRAKAVGASLSKGCPSALLVANSTSIGRRQGGRGRLGRRLAVAH